MMGTKRQLLITAFTVTNPTIVPVRYEEAPTITVMDELVKSAFNYMQNQDKSTTELMDTGLELNVRGLKRKSGKKHSRVQKQSVVTEPHPRCNVCQSQTNNNALCMSMEKQLMKEVPYHPPKSTAGGAVHISPVANRKIVQKSINNYFKPTVTISLTNMQTPTDIDQDVQMSTSQEHDQVDVQNMIISQDNIKIGTALDEGTDQDELMIISQDSEMSTITSQDCDQMDDLEDMITSQENSQIRDIQDEGNKHEEQMINSQDTEDLMIISQDTNRTSQDTRI